MEVERDVAGKFLAMLLQISPTGLSEFTDGLWAIHEELQRRVHDTLVEGVPPDLLILGLRSLFLLPLPLLAHAGLEAVRDAGQRGVHLYRLRLLGTGRSERPSGLSSLVRRNPKDWTLEVFTHVSSLSG
jgi:hypothetical protein